MTLTEKRKTAFLALFKLLSQIGNHANLKNVKFQLITRGSRRTIALGHFSVRGHHGACAGSKWCVELIIPNDRSGTAEVITHCEVITANLESRDSSIVGMINRPLLWVDAIRVTSRIICAHAMTQDSGLPDKKTRESIDALAREFELPD